MGKLTLFLVIFTVACVPPAIYIHPLTGQVMDCQTYGKAAATVRGNVFSEAWARVQCINTAEGIGYLRADLYREYLRSANPQGRERIAVQMQQEAQAQGVDVHIRADGPEKSVLVFSSASLAGSQGPKEGDLLSKQALEMMRHVGFRTIVAETPAGGRLWAIDLATGQVGR